MLNHLKKLSLCISSVLVCAPAVADNAPLMQITEYDERCYGYVPEYVAPDTTVDNIIVKRCWFVNKNTNTASNILPNYPDKAFLLILNFVLE